MIGFPDTPLHGIRPDHLEELIRGRGGADAVREIAAAQYSKTILMIQFLVRRVETLEHPDAAITRTAYGALAEFRRNHPDEFFTVLRNPAVLAWSSRAARELSTSRKPDTARQPGLLAAVALAVALRSGTDLRLELPRHLTGRLDLPAAGRLHLPGTSGRTLTAEVTAGRVTTSRDDSGWTPVTWLDTEHRVALGPLEMTGDQPAGDPADWRETYHQALAVLTARHPRVAAELGALLRQVCPIGAPPGGQTSGTYHDAFGAIATSRPHGPRALALTLAHESEHNKLVALDHLMPLVRPGCRELYHAPWRNDLRPLIGLVHGVYAHVGVAAFWRAELEAGLAGKARRHAETEFRRWSTASAEVAGGLRDNTWLTPFGRNLVRALFTRVRSWKWQRVPVPGKIRDPECDSAIHPGRPA